MTTLRVLLTIGSLFTGFCTFSAPQDPHQKDLPLITWQRPNQHMLAAGELPLDHHAQRAISTQLAQTIADQVHKSGLHHSWSPQRVHIVMATQTGEPLKAPDSAPKNTAPTAPMDRDALPITIPHDILKALNDRKMIKNSASSQGFKISRLVPEELRQTWHELRHEGNIGRPLKLAFMVIATAQQMIIYLNVYPEYSGPFLARLSELHGSGEVGLTRALVAATTTAFVMYYLEVREGALYLTHQFQKQSSNLASWLYRSLLFRPTGSSTPFSPHQPAGRILGIIAASTISIPFMLPGLAIAGWTNFPHMMTNGHTMLTIAGMLLVGQIFAPLNTAMASFYEKNRHLPFRKQWLSENLRSAYMFFLASTMTLLMPDVMTVNFSALLEGQFTEFWDSISNRLRYTYAGVISAGVLAHWRGEWFFKKIHSYKKPVANFFRQAMARLWNSYKATRKNEALAQLRGYGINFRGLHCEAAL